MPQNFAWWPINFNAPNYDEYFKEYLNQKVFFPKEIFLRFLYMYMKIKHCP